VYLAEGEWNLRLTAGPLRRPSGSCLRPPRRGRAGPRRDGLHEVGRVKQLQSLLLFVGREAALELQEHRARLALDRHLAQAQLDRCRAQGARTAARGRTAPADSMCLLTAGESDSLRSQFATLKTAATSASQVPARSPSMAPSWPRWLLASARSVEVSVCGVRAFVRLREVALQHQDLAQRLDSLKDRIPGDAARHVHPQHPAPSCARCSRRYAH
jgi:hypothetical protein